MDRFHVCVIAGVFGALTGTFTCQIVVDLNTVSRHLDQIAADQQQQLLFVHSLHNNISELHKQIDDLGQLTMTMAASAPVVSTEHEETEPVAAPVVHPKPLPTASWLDINSIPPSSVFLDGELLGDTPQPRIKVKPGSHTVTFMKNAKAQVLRVVVAPGETKTASFRFVADDGF